MACFNKRHSKGFFRTCLYRKENNLFLAFQPPRMTKSSWWFRFSHHSISQRNLLYWATWRNEIKTVCSRTLKHKTHEEVRRRGLHWIDAHSQVWKFSGGERTLLRRHTGRSAAQAPTKQSTMMWCPCLRWGAGIYQLGAKQVNLESNNFFKSYQWPGHTGHGKIWAQEPIGTKGLRVIRSGENYIFTVQLLKNNRVMIM